MSQLALTLPATPPAAVPPAGDASLRLSDYDRLRYTAPPAETPFPREFAHHLLAPLAGKAILVAGCGDGVDACLAACNGATVYAFDADPTAVALTRRRLAANGVAARASVARAGGLDDAFPGEAFDAVIGHGVLHRVPAAGLGALADRLHDRLRPGGVAVFTEPVANARLLHALRRRLPLPAGGYRPDARPLDAAGLRALARPFDRTARRDFRALARLAPDGPHRWLRTVALHYADAALLRLPLANRLASHAVLAFWRAP